MNLPWSDRFLFRGRSAKVHSLPNVWQVAHGGAPSTLQADFLARQKSQDRLLRGLYVRVPAADFAAVGTMGEDAGWDWN